MVLAQDSLSMCMVEFCDKKKMERVSLKTNLGSVEGEKIIRF